MADLAARESNPMDSFTTNCSKNPFVGTTIPAPLVVENDAVNHPSHYTFGKIESIDYIDAVGLGYAFCIGNTLKYFQNGDQIRFWDSYPTEQERETTPWEVEDHE